jgi:hypothetical protein
LVGAEKKLQAQQRSEGPGGGGRPVTFILKHKEGAMFGLSRRAALSAVLTMIVVGYVFPRDLAIRSEAFAVVGLVAYLISYMKHSKEVLSLGIMRPRASVATMFGCAGTAAILGTGEDHLVGSIAVAVTMLLAAFLCGRMAAVVDGAAGRRQRDVAGFSETFIIALVGGGLWGVAEADSMKLVALAALGIVAGAMWFGRSLARNPELDSAGVAALLASPQRPAAVVANSVGHSWGDSLFMVGLVLFSLVLATGPGSKGREWPRVVAAAQQPRNVLFAAVMVVAMVLVLVAVQASVGRFNAKRRGAVDGATDGVGR